MLGRAKEYAKSKHQEVNQMYNDKPYEFHLEMVYDVALKFIHMVPKEQQQNVLSACWLHDIIEDARQTYNDVKQATNETIAELVYALTNEKGRNRAERANDKYYAGISHTPNAAFIKFCDRIANYKYSKEHRSSMQKKYESENEKFITQLYTPELDEIAKHLVVLIKN